MSQNDTLATLKAQKLAELRDDVGRIALEKDPDRRIWRQGLVHGRLLELQAFDVLTRRESDAFAKEMQLTLDAQTTLANDAVYTPSAPSATIDWIALDEPNTPRGEVSRLTIGTEMISLEFKGPFAGTDSNWSGSIVLKRTTAFQRISGYYVDIPGPKMKAAPKKVPYTVTGCFSDDTCKSFTGQWTEGADGLPYEFNIDID